MLIAFHRKLSWVSIAPFGRPVVPEVYMITQRSSSETSRVTRSGLPEASSSSYSLGPPAARSAWTGMVTRVRSEATSLLAASRRGAMGPETKAKEAPESART